MEEYVTVTEIKEMLASKDEAIAKLNEKLIKLEQKMCSRQQEESTFTSFVDVEDPLRGTSKNLMIWFSFLYFYIYYVLFNTHFSLHWYFLPNLKTLRHIQAPKFDQRWNLCPSDHQ